MAQVLVISNDSCKSKASHFKEFLSQFIYMCMLLWPIHLFNQNIEVPMCVWLVLTLESIL